MEGERQEDQLQTEIGRMADESIKPSALQFLPLAQRDIRAEGVAQRKDRRRTNDQTKNQNPEGRRPQPAETPRHVDREKIVHPLLDSERCDNHDPENDLRAVILQFALAPARSREHRDEDFARKPYIGQRIEKEFESHDRPTSSLLPTRAACGVYSRSRVPVREEC